MNIGEILYFAPGLRFDEVDLQGENLPKHFELRIKGFYLQPAEVCVRDEHAFAAGLILISCIDALARYRFGNGVEEVENFIATELSGFHRDNGLARRFYIEFRHGLVHEARIKNGGQFSFQRRASVVEESGLLLVNPIHLLNDVESALTVYVRLLESDSQERSKLALRLRKDHARDFHPFGPVARN